MADRRMIHRAVICSDEFIEMSHEAQALFYQLQIDADSYGLLSSAKRIIRTINAQESALQELVDGGFVISFGNGVIAMTHWNVANSRKNDRTERTYFPKELAMLSMDENKVYHLMESSGIRMETDGIRWIPLSPQNSVAQNSLEENSSEERRSEKKTPPTLGEVRQFMSEYASGKGVNVVRSSERFWNHHQANGWKMQDWKASARNWIDDDAQRQRTAQQNNPALAYSQRDDVDYSGQVIDLTAMGEELANEQQT